MGFVSPAPSHAPSVKRRGTSASERTWSFRTTSDTSSSANPWPSVPANGRVLASATSSAHCTPRPRGEPLVLSLPKDGFCMRAETTTLSRH
jgi:hypothetical protein